MNKLVCLLLTSSFMLSSLNVSASQETNISGFGTLGVAWFSNPNADFQYNQTPRGPGRSMTFDAGLDSNLGIQLDHRWNDRYSMALQGVSYHTASDDFSPSVSLAFLRINLSNHLSVRLGRFQNPAFLYSDSRHIHFDQPGVRPVKIVYGLSPHFQMDGGELSYRFSIGQWDHDIQVGSGGADFPSTLGQFNIYSNYARWTIEQYPLTLAATFSQVHTNLRNESLTALLGTIGSLEGNSLSNQLTLNEKYTNFYTLSLKYDNNNWLLLSEYGHFSSPSFLGDQSGAYATLGRYFGKYLAFSTLSKRWSDQSSSATVTPIGSIGVDKLLMLGSFDTTMVTLGLRQEIGHNMRLKYQVDFIYPEKNVFGPYVNHNSNYDFSNPGSDVLLSVALDVLF